MQIEQWRSDQLSAHLSNIATGTVPPSFDDPDVVNRTARQHEEMAFKHLDLSFQNWQNMPPIHQKEKWQLEILRAFAREKEKKNEVDAQLVRVQQEANALREQVETLSRCQWPREFALFPPEPASIGRETAKELGRTGSSKSELWDYDRLVAKWKRHIRDDGMRRAGLAAARATPTSVPPSPVQTPQTGQSSRMSLTSVNKKPRLSNGRGTQAGEAAGDQGTNLPGTNAVTPLDTARRFSSIHSEQS